eukprot:3453221-Pleurochrysis_carterae.AAC.1
MPCPLIPAGGGTGRRCRALSSQRGGGRDAKHSRPSGKGGGGGAEHASPSGRGGEEMPSTLVPAEE